MWDRLVPLCRTTNSSYIHDFSAHTENSQYHVSEVTTVPHAITSVIIPNATSRHVLSFDLSHILRSHCYPFKYEIYIPSKKYLRRHSFLRVLYRLPSGVSRRPWRLFFPPGSNAVTRLPSRHDSFPLRPYQIILKVFLGFLSTADRELLSEDTMLLPPSPAGRENLILVGVVYRDYVHGIAISRTKGCAWAAAVLPFAGFISVPVQPTCSRYELPLR